MPRNTKSSNRAVKRIQKALIRRKSNRHRTLSAESLEYRQLLAVTPIDFDAATGVVEITGSAGADWVRVEDTTPDQIEVTFRTGGETTRQQFSQSLIDLIVFNGDHGDDSFNNLTSISSTVDGGGGNDFLSGGIGADRLLGGAGNDVIYGNNGNDYIDGGEGDDRLYGQDGSDILYGQSGADRLEGGDQSDTLYGNEGDDILLGGLGNDTLRGHAGKDTIYGNHGDDTLTGGDDNDTIYGNDGNDYLDGEQGDDSLYGDAGADRLFGSSGDDRLEGGTENDLIYGHDGNDLLKGDTGNDILRGQSGNDVLYGGDGEDTLTGGDDNDKLYGNGGNDHLDGEQGDDSIYGESGADILLGSSGSDRLEGGEDDDLLYGHEGNDILKGGLGDDTLRGNAGEDILIGNDGNDTLTGGDHNDTLYGSAGNDFLDGESGDDSLFGDEGHDRLFGQSGNDRLEGGAGNDLIYGHAGEDTLLGNAGNDILRGQSGNDLLYGGDGDDLLTGEDDADTIYGGNGDDEINGGDGDDLLLGEAGRDYLFGELGSDRLEGGDDGDFIFGGHGDDNLRGGLGDDNLHGSDGIDLIYGNAGNDSVLGGSGNDLIFGGFGDDDIYGGLGDDLILGESGSDTLMGDGGNDRLEGGDDSDVILGGDGDDNLHGGLGNDTLQGSDGSDLILGNGGNDSISGGNGNDLLYGGDGDDIVLGNSGADKLYGEEGNDALAGHEGEDRLEGNAGNDLIIGGAGGDTLFGMSGEDLLIAAITVFDESEADLAQLLSHWSSNATYQERVAYLSGHDSIPYSLQIQATVFDDNVANTVWGGSDDDWMISATTNATYDPLGNYSPSAPDQHATHETGHHQHSTIVTDTLPVVEGFALIDSIDAMPDRSKQDIITQSLPHTDDPVKAKEHLRLFQLIRYADITHTAIADGNWSDPSIWQDGQVPSFDARVLVPIGVHVKVDAMITEEMFSVRVDGTLSFDTTKNTELRVDTIVVTRPGRFEMGNSNSAVGSNASARLVFTDNGEIDRSWDPFGISRGFISHGSVEVHGEHKTPFVEVGGSLPAGSTFIPLVSAPDNWQVGDKVAIAGTTSTSNQDEERTILSISGSQIEVAPLNYNHVSPATNMRFHVANLTRNAIMESEGSESSRRGHVMFMHNRDIAIHNAAFNKLGRTDKSVVLDDPEVNDQWQLIAGTGSNGRARYAVHFHRNGAIETGSPATVQGSVVNDSDGWGFVNHSSYVHVVDSIAFDVLGSGFVTETGDEVGLFARNLAMNLSGDGSGLDVSSRRTAQDFGFGGEGFWLQGPGVSVIDNVASGAAGGAFTYYMRGLNEFGYETEFAAANLLDSSIANGNETVLVRDVAPRPFHGNVAYASTAGLLSRYVLYQSTNGSKALFSNSIFWNNERGVHAPYAQNTTYQDIIIFHDATKKPNYGFDRNLVTKNIDLIDNQIIGYEVGLLVPATGTTLVSGGYYANEHNFVLGGGGTASRELIIEPTVVEAPYPW